jgi:integrase
MVFMLDKQELKPGLVIFRRKDVNHRNWYCRLKIPNVDRYKTIALETTDINAAKEEAFKQDYRLQVKIEEKIPLFDKTFGQMANEYSDFQKQRADAGEITQKRWKTEAGNIKVLNRYLGSIQIAMISEIHWKGYPLWRRSNGKGRGPSGKVSDWTIRSEMSTFRSVMLFASDRKHIPENTKMFRTRLKLGKPRGEAFNAQEYRALHTFARTIWINADTKHSQGLGKRARSRKNRWEREVFYWFMLVMTNTGKRPSEAKNLRRRDIGDVMQKKDGQPFIPIDVRGKSKYRQLVAPRSVGTYLARITTLVDQRMKELGKETKPDDFVFLTYEGERARTLYASLLGDLLKESGLLLSASGKRRNTYSFRHTYATFRLMKGVKIHDLAQQMGTSSEMIEEVYSHITPVTNADQILQGIPWEPVIEVGSGEEASGVNADAAGSKAKPRAKRTSEGKDLRTAGKASRSTRRR